MIYEIPDGDYAGSLVNLNYCMQVVPREHKNVVTLIFPGQDNYIDIPCDHQEDKRDIVSHIRMIYQKAGLM